MSRYRKIEVKTWGDAKFRALSPIQPSGQALWLYLLTAPSTGPIPGLFRAGRAALAEDLGWAPEAFAEAFQEVLKQGMVKADFEARLVWIPNAIRHNPPASPNVVKSWRTEFDLLPECSLKAEAFSLLKAYVLEMGEGFAKAFQEAFGKASRKPSSKTMPNQEQEQEQEQEPLEPSHRTQTYQDRAPRTDVRAPTQPRPRQPASAGRTSDDAFGGVE